MIYCYYLFLTSLITFSLHRFFYLETKSKSLKVPAILFCVSEVSRNFIKKIVSNPKNNNYYSKKLLQFN